MNSIFPSSWFTFTTYKVKGLDLVILCISWNNGSFTFPGEGSVMQWRMHLFSIVNIMPYENCIPELNYKYIGWQGLWTFNSNIKERL